MKHLVLKLVDSHYTGTTITLHWTTPKSLVASCKTYKHQTTTIGSGACRSAGQAGIRGDVVASKLMANLEGKKAAAPGPARKKRKRKAK